jgi:hypothetical protein
MHKEDMNDKKKQELVTILQKDFQARTKREIQEITNQIIVSYFYDLIFVSTTNL